MFCKRDHIHITFISTGCYNCSIFIVVNVLLYLVCKSDFITGPYTGENSSASGVRDTSQLQASVGGLGTHPPWIRGCSCAFLCQGLVPHLLELFLTPFQSFRCFKCILELSAAECICFWGCCNKTPQPAGLKQTFTVPPSRRPEPEMRVQAGRGPPEASQLLCGQLSSPCVLRASLRPDRFL